MFIVNYYWILGGTVLRRILLLEQLFCSIHLRPDFVCNKFDNLLLVKWSSPFSLGGSSFKKSVLVYIEHKVFRTSGFHNLEFKVEAHKVSLNSSFNFIDLSEISLFNHFSSKIELVFSLGLLLYHKDVLFHLTKSNRRLFFHECVNVMPFGF